MLNEIYLANYCAMFSGYGKWEAPVWFIGIEEAGGYNESTAAAHIGTWHERGRVSLDSVPEFRRASDIHQWHVNDAKPQPTWEQLIRLLLVAQGKPDSPAAILDYQRARLGVATGETCLLELFPLPSPSVRVWNYGKWTTLPWLQTRPAYEQKIAAQRIEAIRAKIELCKPPVVVFYGSSQLKHWRKIMGAGTYARPIADKLIAHERDGTAFFVIKQPGNFWHRTKRDDYFREIGHYFSTIVPGHDADK